MDSYLVVLDLMFCSLSTTDNSTSSTFTFVTTLTLTCQKRAVPQKCNFNQTKALY